MIRSEACGNTGMSRRTMLGVLGSVFLAASLPCSAASLVPDSISSEASVLVIGRAVHLAGVVESTANSLADTLALPAPASYPDPDLLSAAMSARIKADFATGDIVIVEGWALSLTEARLCALIALEAEDGRDVWIGA